MNIDIGTRRQLFFDNHIIEMVQTMTRRMHLPVKHERNPLIRKGPPVGAGPYIRTGTMCVAHDPDEKLYKCWYCDYAWDYRTYGQHAPGEAGGAGLPEVAVGGLHGLRLPVRDHGQPLAVRRVRGRHRVAQARSGLPGGRRPQDQHLPGRRPSWPGVRGLLLSRRAGAGPGQALKSLYWRQLSEQLSVTESQIRVAHSADGRSWAGGEEPITVGRIRERRLGDEMMVLPDVETGQYLLTVRETAMATG